MRQLIQVRQGADGDSQLIGRGAIGMIDQFFGVGLNGKEACVIGFVVRRTENKAIPGMV